MFNNSTKYYYTNILKCIKLKNRLGGEHNLKIYNYIQNEYSVEADYLETEETVYSLILKNQHCLKCSLLCY